MAKDDRPTLHFVAGPNGAGKSTLVATKIQPLNPSAEFVNADELARAHYGHAAETLEESRTGQRLAEERRQALMAARKSFIAESTFSHPSKVDLIRQALAAGYRVNLYHVHVRSAALSVYRVSSRVEAGGHPVPEDKIRDRYARNQALIHQASQLADRTHVFDNSRLNEPPRRVLELRRGEAVFVGRAVPRWARDLYARELAHVSLEAQNRPAASFAAAHERVHKVLGQGARTFVARAKGSYRGPVIGETELHLVQQIGRGSAIAHFTDRMTRAPAVGERVRIDYDEHGRATAVSERGPNARAADAWRRDPEQAARDYPALAEEMAKGVAIVRASRAAGAREGSSESEREAFVARVASRVASDLEQGRPLPDPRARRASRDDDHER